MRVLDSDAGGGGNGRMATGVWSVYGRDRELLKRAKEFQAKQTELSHHVLAFDPGNNRGSLTGDETRGGWGGGWYRELDGLFQAKEVGTGYASTRRANIDGLAKLDKLGTIRIGSPDENRDLDPDS